MARASFMVVVSVLLSLIGSSVSASSCPSIATAGITCIASSNCTRLECQVLSGGQLTSATVSITLQRCDDPPLIDMHAQGEFSNGSRFNFSHPFRKSESIYSGSANVGATVQRNQTSLQFSAYLETTPLQYLIPLIEYDINTTECLCTSMKELANDINTPFEHDCSPTPECSGVSCELDILADIYIMNVYIVSCHQPPAVYLLLGDAEGNPFTSLLIVDNSVTIITVGGFHVLVVPVIIHHNYSMEVELNLLLPEFGFINIIPRRTIILDPSDCETPPTATPTDPPLPLTPPPGASDPCIVLFHVANTTMDPLVCRVVSSCTSLLCEFASGNDAYEINIRFLMRESDIKAYVTFLPLQSMSLQWQVTARSETRQFDLEQGSSLVIVANATEDVVTLQMLLREADQQDSLLMPTTSIPLLPAGNCLWWVPVIANHHSCSYLPDCQGILCITYAGYIDTTSLSLERCADPLSVKLVLTRGDSVLFQGNFTESSQFEYGFVTMGRNATHLKFSATALSGDIAYHLVPDITIPLDPHMCSCQSLEELANNTHSPLEHDCRTNEVCDGVRCVLDVFGTTYHLETILLSCEEPPALESVVEDENNVPLYTGIYNETGLYTLQVSGTTLPLYVVIEHHDYSMDVAAYLTIPIIGNNTIVPPTKLFLDPTSCRNPPTVPPTSPSSPTSPPTTPITVTPTCQALIDITKTTAEETFMCTAIFPTTGDMKDDCNTLECELVLQTSNYMVTLELYRQGEEFVASVTVTSDTNTLKDVDVKETQQFSVKLQGGELLFDFKTQGKALGIQVMLIEGGTTTTLVNATVPLQDKGEGTTSPSSNKSDNNKSSKIAAAVTVVVVCVVAGAVVVAVLVGVWFLRKRRQRLQFDFKPMSYSDVQLGEDDNDEKKVEDDDKELGDDAGNHYEPVDTIQ